MQESKENDCTGEFETPPDDASGRPSGPPAGTAADPDGWQQYRRWISKAPAPRSRRGGVDPSLYTWKGYRNWTEQVKRNWSDS
jgi:hypothetical protein